MMSLHHRLFLLMPDVTRNEPDRSFLRFKRRFLSSFLVMGLLLFPLIEWMDWDRAISGLFFDRLFGLWLYCDREPFSTIDHGIVWISITVGVLSWLVYAITWFVNRNSWPNRAGLIMTLLLLAGPVLLVNTALKPFFARARPREIARFDGKMIYTAAWQPAISPFRNSSFPSGHASIGFYLLGPAILLRRNYRLFVSLFTVGAILGATVSFSRIIQGGHFISDILCSMLLMIGLAWGISEAVYYFWPLRKANSASEEGLLSQTRLAA